MKIKEVEEMTTKLFRSYLKRLGSNSSPESYEYYDGEMWYKGVPLIFSKMTKIESNALEYALGEMLNRLAY